MRCQRCGEKEATVTISRIINDNKEKMTLCSDCAAEEGYFAWSFEPQFPLHSLLKSMMADMGSTPAARRLSKAKTSKECSTCGRSYANFSQTGFLGCGDCYEAFSDAIRPLLRRIQGGTVHRGRRPNQTDDSKSQTLHSGQSRDERLSDLREQLEKAIDKEAYERAAELRDMIIELEEKDDE